MYARVLLQIIIVSSSFSVWNSSSRGIFSSANSSVISRNDEPVTRRPTTSDDDQSRSDASANNDSSLLFKDPLGNAKSILYNRTWLLEKFSQRQAADAPNSTVASNVTCYTCRPQDLKICTMLAGTAVVAQNFSEGTPADVVANGNTERCVMFDAKITKMSPVLFGLNYMYKDTTECRTLVNKYNCVSWGANSNTCPNAPLAPCRSLCMEVAQKCIQVQHYFTFINQTCASIDCDRSSEKQLCTPGTKEADGTDEEYDRCSLDIYELVISHGFRMAQIGTLYFSMLFASILWPFCTFPAEHD